VTEQRSPKLDELIRALAAFERPPGLAEIERILRGVELTREELGSHVSFNHGSKRYCRNTVAASGWYELLVVCWAPGQQSHIHDHAGSACAFRVIEGTGSETTYLRSEGGLVRPVSAEILTRGDVCASHDADIHRVANDTDDEDFITLHLYAPALSLMNTYEPEPGAEDERRRLVARAVASYSA